MIIHNSKNRIKVLNSFIAILILFLQVNVCCQSQTLSNHKPVAWGIDNDVSALTVINNLNQQNIIRQNPEINLSPANILFDKFDITSIQDLTNSKKIYGGSFSYQLRYRTFQAIQFSTST